MTLDIDGVTEPLKGLRVLDVGEAIAGPFCATLLADFGADVVKVEPLPGGDHLRNTGPFVDGRSVRWVIDARNKRSVAVDRKNDEGRAVIADLMRRADVVVDNHRLPSLPAWDSWEAFHQDCWRTIVVLVTGFGQTSPRRKDPCYDRIAIAMSGWQSLTGHKDAPPVRPGIAVADYLSGIFGFMGTMLALRAREVLDGPEGRGQIVDIALYEPLVRLMEANLAYTSITGINRTREGNENPNAVPGGTFMANDGAYVALSAVTDRHFRKLWDLMEQDPLPEGDPRLTGEGRVKNRAELQQTLGDWIAGRSSDQVLADAAKAELPATRVNTIADVLKEEEFLTRGIVRPFNHPALGDFVMQGVAPRLSMTPGSVRRLGPDLGADGRHVLADWLGMSNSEVAALEDRGVIARSAT